MGENLNIFTIYTSEDTAVMQHIVKRLKPSEKADNISIWSENPILPEQAWKPQSESRFEQTDVFILLVSDAFMHSQFIQQLEFKMVIDQYKAGKSTVVPVILDQCPWDIDFRSDDYNFNLNELGVLPEGAKPIKEWESSEQVYDDIAKEIKAVIASLSGTDTQEELEEDEEEKLADVKEEEQIAILFDEEKEAQEEKKRKEEAVAKQVAEEIKAREEEAQTKQKAAEQQKQQQEEAESKRRAEEQRLRAEAESKRKAEEQKQREATESRKLEEAKRKKEEAELKIQEEQERRRLEQENQQRQTTAQISPVKETSEEGRSRSRKRFLIGGIVALLAIIGIWTFNSGTDEAIQPSVNTNTDEVEDSIPVEKTETESAIEEESLPELTIGDQYDGGIVFSIDSDGKSGKVVHIDDAGPMPWADAMIIHDQLGKGWRLPTLDELKILYSTLGQGASNSAEFADKLYWSATLYDEYQARLLQFRTGNTSYHYNKEAEHRQFLVRAVRDFTR